MDFLVLPQLNTFQNMGLLQKIGDCVASSICFKDSGSYIKEILLRVQRDGQEKYSDITIKVYLLIILKVIKDKSFLNQKNKTSKVAEAFNKNYNPEHLSALLVQFDRNSK